MSLRSLLVGWLFAGLFNLFAMGSASAQTLMTSGVWSAERVTIRGSEVCLVKTSWPSGRNLSISRWENEDQLVVQAVDPGWNIRGGRIATTMYIGSQSWTASSLVLDSTRGIEFHIPSGQMAGFIRDFIAADDLVLVMGGNNVRWTVNLDGSDDVVRAFGRCVGRMRN